MVTTFSISMINLYPHYQNKILAFAGGIFDQPNSYIQAMAIIDQYLKQEQTYGR